MSLQIASDLTPSSGGTYYLLEDVYLKGGFSIRASIADRDKIAISNLKLGQLILTLADSKIWKVTELVVQSRQNPDAVEKVTWTEFLTNNAGLADAPSDGKTYGRKDGAWVQVTGGSGATPVTPKTRIVAIQVIDPLPVSGKVDVTIPLAVSCIVLKLSVTRPVKVSAFGTSTRDEANPYQFLATDDHLTDDGSMLLADGSVFRSRNFSILANMEEPANENLYFTVESVDDLEGPVTLTITYLPLEVVSDAGTTGTTP